MSVKKSTDRNTYTIARMLQIIIIRNSLRADVRFSGRSEIWLLWYLQRKTNNICQHKKQAQISLFEYFDVSGLLSSDIRYPAGRTG